jgi:hypothetical protein
MYRFIGRNKMSHHSHSYFGMTTYQDGHIHHYGGITSNEESGVPHTHTFEGETTYKDDHDHKYETRTGLSIMVPGGHTHYFQTKTEMEDGHIHYMYGYTSID